MCRQEEHDGGVRVGHSVFITRSSLQIFSVSAFQAVRVTRQSEVCVSALLTLSAVDAHAELRHSELRPGGREGARGALIYLRTPSSTPISARQRNQGCPSNPEDWR